MGAAAAQEGAKEGAGCGFPVCFLRLLPLSPCVLTCVIAQERHTHLYMPLAVDRSLSVDVRYLCLSSRGLCLADHVLSQLSPSPQSGASMPVCYLFCHVFAIANCRFPQPVDALHWVVPRHYPLQSCEMCYCLLCVATVRLSRLSLPAPLHRVCDSLLASSFPVINHLASMYNSMDCVQPLHSRETIGAHDLQYHGTYMDCLWRAASGIFQAWEFGLSLHTFPHH
jgi:hypothetical protein